MSRSSFDNIRKYFKTGCFSGVDRLLSFIDFRIPYLKNSKKIFHYYQITVENKQAAKMDIQTEEYHFNNSYVLEMKHFLEINLKNNLSGAYTHGSLGTDEIINYSDFDGLVILNNYTFRSASEIFKTAVALRKSERIMRKMDPLQHHGWFIITEKELEDYPSDYFPPLLYKHVKCLTGKNNFSIKRNLTEVESKKHFLGFCKHLIQNIQKNTATTNYYDIKSMLSGFMLLPAIYLQLKHPEGVFKKDSFDLLRKELSETDYKVMDDISQIRNDWNYTPPNRYRMLLKVDNALLNHYFHKKWSGVVETSLAKTIDTLKPEMLRLVNTLLSKAENEL